MSKQNFYFILTLKTLANFLVLSGLTVLFFFGYNPIRETISELFRQKTSQAQNTFGEVFSLYTISSFGKLLAIPPSLQSEPVSKNASIIIEKININSPIIWDISPTNEKEYNQALKEGIAHVRGTAKPSEATGNTYLFAHSTINPTQIQKYGAVFTNLKNLKKYDRVTVFFNEERFDYQVKKVEIVEGYNTTPLLREVAKPTLTLQTCHPPGIEKDRLIITAELIGVY